MARGKSGLRYGEKGREKRKGERGRKGKQKKEEGEKKRKKKQKKGSKVLAPPPICARALRHCTRRVFVSTVRVTLLPGSHAHMHVAIGNLKTRCPLSMFHIGSTPGRACVAL